MGSIRTKEIGWQQIKQLKVMMTSFSRITWYSKRFAWGRGTYPKAKSNTDVQQAKT